MNFIENSIEAHYKVLRSTDSLIRYVRSGAQAAELLHRAYREHKDSGGMSAKTVGDIAEYLDGYIARRMANIDDGEGCTGEDS